MFSHIREVVRIVSYREPQDVPNIVIAERVDPVVPVAGKHIARFFEIVAIVYVIGLVAGPLGDRLGHLIPARTVGMTSVVGAVGALLMLIVNWLRADIEHNIRLHINLGNTLAPFFGRRLDNTFRILGGSTRVS
jgi:hypothetical protein